MTETLSSLNGGHVFVLVIVVLSIGGGLSLGALGIVTDYYRKRNRDDMEATLKMEMIQRGMSSSEIREVLEARMSPNPVTKWCNDWARHMSPNRDA